MTLDEIEKLQKEVCPKFSVFAKDQLPMPGEKKYLKDILNNELLIIDFKIRESTRRAGTKCLQIQFLLNDTVCVTFTGSTVLIDQIKSVYDKGLFPFKATIVKIDKYYSLS